MSDPKQSNPLVSRQEKFNNLLKSAGLDGMVLNPGQSLVYLTGLHFHLSERPVVVLFRRNEIPIIVIPKLELEKLKNLPFEINAFPYGEDPSKWGEVFTKAIQSTNLESKHIGVEPRQLRFLEFRLLSEAAPGTTFISGEESLSKLRMRKDESELSAMRKAVEIAEHALKSTLPLIKIGITELELARELTLQLFRAGCDPLLAFTPIVSSGPNSANPHAAPSVRKLAYGDLLVIDWGASYQGYCSDITRTFAVGKPEPEFERISQIVLESNLAGRQSAKPGIAANVVDRAARSIIDEAGYGKYFTHRTGHGLGMEGHEPPYLHAGNPLILEPGMTFTIEPGIYLPGRNGIRIEDDVAISSTGCECLTSLPRELKQLL